MREAIVELETVRSLTLEECQKSKNKPGAMFFSFITEIIRNKGCLFYNCQSRVLAWKEVRFISSFKSTLVKGGKIIKRRYFK